MARGMSLAVRFDGDNDGPVVVYGTVDDTGHIADLDGYGAARALELAAFVHDAAARLAALYPADEGDDEEDPGCTPRCPSCREPMRLARRDARMLRMTGERHGRCRSCGGGYMIRAAVRWTVDATAKEVA